MKETDLHTELRDSFNILFANSFWHKFTDFPIGSILTLMRGHGIPEDRIFSIVRFNIKRPFDILLIHDGKPVGIEAKMVKETSLPFERIKEHQIEALSALNKAGGKGFVVVNFKGYASANRLFAIDIDSYFKIQHLVLHEREKKSFNIRDIEDCQTILELKRIKVDKKNIWDITPLFNHLLPQLTIPTP